MGAFGFALDLLRRTRGAPPFDPATLFAGGEAGFWYDPSDLSSMFQDIAGTIPITADAEVARILDKSGRGIHISQTTTAARPLLRQDSAGRRYLDFDGIDDRLRINAASWNIPQPISAVIAGEILDGGGTPARMFDSGFSATQRVLFGRQSESAVTASAGSFAVQEGGVSFPTGTQVWGMIFNGASSRLRRNGVERSAGDAGTHSMTGVSMGVAATASDYLRGRIHGFLLIGRVLSGEEMEKAERFLAEKAGVAW